jgi:hypothetical protein
LEAFGALEALEALLFLAAINLFPLNKNSTSSAAARRLSGEISKTLGK